MTSPLHVARESLYEHPNNKSIHQVKNHGKGGSDSIYVNEAFNFKVRTNLIVDSRDIKSHPDRKKKKRYKIPFNRDLV